MIATSDLAGRVIDKEEFLTDPDKTLNEVISIVREFTTRYKGSIEGVGVSLPGLVDPSTGNALYIPYFSGAIFRLEMISKRSACRS